MKKFSILLLVLPFIFSCNPKSGLKKYNFKGETMGSYYGLTYYAADEKIRQSEIESFLAAFNKSLSTWDKNSLITNINNEPRQHEADSLFINLYTKSKQVWELSKGSFDPSATPLFEAWGFGLANAESMDSVKVDSLRFYVGMDKSYLQGTTLFKTMPGVKFSFNAIAPGYAADLIGQLLLKKGVTDFLIDIGGEFVSHGTKNDGSAWKVGIEKPIENKTEQNAAQAVITLTANEALATSGNYRKFYYKDGKKYSHTINPKTGYPVNHNLLSATVITTDGATADAFATTCMVLGFDDAKKFIAEQKGVKAYFIYDENGELKEFVTDNLKEQFAR